jgi:hypothetical protein
MLLAPFGLALARRRDASVLSAIWIALNLSLVALGGFAGPRLRAPFEPHLIVFASVATVEGFRGLRTRGLVLAGAVSLAAATLLLPQVPRSLSAWPDYGIRWQHRPKGWRTLVRGSAGFNVQCAPAFRWKFGRAAAGEIADTVVELRLGRRRWDGNACVAREARQLQYAWPEERSRSSSFAPQ